MGRMNVYFNHDAGIDDLVSLFLLLQMDQVEVTGVSVIPADGYLTPGTEASRKIIDRFGRKSVEVARSNSRGHYPFPKEWRMHPFFVDALPLLNESGKVDAPLSNLPAHEHLAQKVKEYAGKTTLLCTGPLTDVARALDFASDIEKKIERLIWMGGTLNPVGNVQEPEHDGTAEWNAFWDPEAVARVWQSSIPVRMVALESTNQVPLSVPIRNHWASLRKYTGIDFLGQCYAAVPPLVHFETNSTYYLWDVLTTMTAGNPNLVHTKKVRTIVHTEEPSQGRIEESVDGREVEIVYNVNADAFFESIESLAKKARQ
ncbi:nucleoside hydrolase [Sporolactobacillus shoreicorticis]|uniref:Nucleoside hydrolase n=1 Tax=Sporolactobacillus shoreicorticis TaxID=1923877 RepID=A0ABW5S6M4_9BACL|nr:nucleoside hydrolase [Sporolactobacillus shoreicorticis]MCO7127194.1 nucleoside hydrolase [Sporolactobacillus shoreicorticis]